MLIFFLAVSLSMDACSLSLAYGFKNKRELKPLPLIVGLFHFVMPLLGCFIGDVVISLFNFNTNFLMVILFSIIGVGMIIDSFNDDKISEINSIFDMLIFAFAVSMDSFILGVSLRNITNHIFVSSIIFCVISAIFTFIGLKFGEFIGRKIGKYADIIGGILIILLGISNVFKN